MTRLIPLFILLLFAAVGCDSGSGPDFNADRPIPRTGESVPEIDAYARAFMEKWDVPGAAYAVVWQGRLVVAAGYGYADLARTQPVRPDHLFRVASVSKPITAVAVLKAVEDGLVSLDAKAFDLLADLLPPTGPADARLLDITVEDLLHHTSGFTVYGNNDPFRRTKEVASVMGVPNPPSSEAIVGFMARQPLGFAPGEGFAYTNVGYVTLGRIIERVTGMPYEDYVRSQVFAPMGVTRARIGGARREERLDGEVEYDSRGIVWPSIFDGESNVPAAYGGVHTQAFDASSGWVLSAVDLARFATSVDGEATVAELLSPSMQRYMVTPPPSSSVGAAWFVREVDGFRLWLHQGIMPGTTAYLATREDGITVAAVLNTVIEKDLNDFVDDFVEGFSRAVISIKTMPDRDLFPRYFSP